MPFHWKIESRTSHNKQLLPSFCNPLNVQIPATRNKFTTNKTLLCTYLYVCATWQLNCYFILTMRVYFTHDIRVKNTFKLLLLVC